MFELIDNEVELAAVEEAYNTIFYGRRVKLKVRC